MAFHRIHSVDSIRGINNGAHYCFLDQLDNTMRYTCGKYEWIVKRVRKSMMAIVFRRK